MQAILPVRQVGAKTTLIFRIRPIGRERVATSYNPLKCDLGPDDTRSKDFDFF